MLRKVLWASLLLLVVAGAVVAVHPPFRQKALALLPDSLSSGQQLITYYQWTDATGNLQISQTPPAGGQEYVTFESSSDLLSNNNNVSEDLAKKQRIYQSLPAASGSRAQSSSPKKATSSTSGTILNAPNRVRQCTEINKALAQARNQGSAQSEIDRLKRQQKANRC